jgi:hypothetical protein
MPINRDRTGYAESADGLDWLRKDEEVGIGTSGISCSSGHGPPPTPWSFSIRRYCTKAGINTSGKERLAINHQFIRSFLKQQIDYVRARALT